MHSLFPLETPESRINMRVRVRLGLQTIFQNNADWQIQGEQCELATTIFQSNNGIRQVFEAV